PPRTVARRCRKRAATTGPCGTSPPSTWTPCWRKLDWRSRNGSATRTAVPTHPPARRSSPCPAPGPADRYGRWRGRASADVGLTGEQPAGDDEPLDVVGALARLAGARTVDLTSRPSRTEANRLYSG